MTETPQILLAHHLKALKLPTFLREYDKVARLCAADVDHRRLDAAHDELRGVVERAIPVEGDQVEASWFSHVFQFP